MEGAEKPLRRGMGGVLPPLVLLAATLALSGCEAGDPTRAPRPALEIRMMGGASQFAPPGERVPEPLQVLVREADTEEPVGGVLVEWGVVVGNGASLDRLLTYTDSTGRASNRLVLGSEPGPYRVQAVFRGLLGPPAEFGARAVLPPDLTRLPDGPVRAGDTIRIEGRNFSPESRENVVLFSGIRGEVVGGTEEALRVRVPSCLPNRTVTVEVRLGPVAGEAGTLGVLEAPAAARLSLAFGEDRTFFDPEGLSCHRLPSEEDARYLAVVQSATPVSGGVHRYRLVTMGEEGGPSGAAPVFGEAAPVPSRVPAVGGPSRWREGAVAGAGREEPGAAHAAFEERLRRWEAELVASGPVPTPPRAAEVPSPVPTPGDRREFNVLGPGHNLETVEAEVRYVSGSAILYVDLEAPEGGLDDEELEELALEFDHPIRPTVVERFGEESDLDGNGRVIILLTPVVNRLTNRGADGFVGGFFFGLDLMPDRPGSNGGEIFYALVPDPEGEFGDPRSRRDVFRVLPPILAHEFQHMVHFNQRILLRGAPSTEALWLSEGLATTAEELVGEVYQLHNPQRALQYQSGNFLRARRYLENPADVSLIVTVGSGTLAERGAGWLYLRYLRSQTGRDQILTELTQTTRTGVSNVLAVVGGSWPTWFADWTGALYLDGIAVPVDRRLTFPGFSLRGALQVVGEGFPLEPEELAAGESWVTGALPASAAEYFLLEVPPSGGLAISLAGPEGGPVPEGSRLQLTVIRIR